MARSADGRTVRGRLALLVVVFLAGAALAGCAREDRTEAPTVLRVLLTDDWVTPPVVAAVRQFERTHPGVRVDIDRTAIRNIPDTVAAAIANGVVPDVVQAHAFAAAAQGMAEPLDDLWARSLDPSEFLPGALEDVTWAGGRYGVPLDTNALLLLYNAEHFAAAGLPPPVEPMSFAAFEAAAAALSTPDGSRRALSLPTSTWRTAGWVRANGGELVEVGDDGRVRLTLDAPEVVSALELLSRLVRNNRAFPPRAADSHSGDAVALFQAGSSSMLATGSWDLATLRRTPGGERYRPALLPAGAGGESGSVTGGSSLFVPKGSRLRGLAFDFMVHLISDDYALRLAKEQGRLPVRARVYDDSYFQTPDLAVVLRQLRTARPFVLDAFPEVNEVFAGAVDEVIREGKEPSAVLRAAQEKAQGLVAGGTTRATTRGTT